MPRRSSRLLAECGALSGVLLSAAACAAKAVSEPPIGYHVVAEYPHDTVAYTQGLVLPATGWLLESTGLYGRSDLRSVTLATGVTRQSVPLPADRFGEGLTLHGGRLFQLTWQSGIAYVYDTAGLRLRDSLRYRGEGWGLTSDGTSLIMSDGSDTLRFLDPETFGTRKLVPVRFSTQAAVRKLNELEYSRGEIFGSSG